VLTQLEVPIAVVRQVGWCSLEIRRPPRGRVVEVMIRDERGERNHCRLQLGPGQSWFREDGRTYVYWTPTHWRDVE
jgi:hypothetical protein